MLEVLQFVFSSFWIWLGCVILLSVAVGGIVGVAGAIAALRGEKP
jgi:hypothetical protein